MRTLSLDILEKAELPPAQAHAILKVMEMEMTAAQETLATKADIGMLRFELKSEMAEIRSELLIQMKSLEGRMARWVLTCILGQTAVLAGFGYFALTHLHR
jgi:hypothetical protein